MIYPRLFDRVWHAGILHKLKPFGISGHILSLISSFLSNRWLPVVVDGKPSQEHPVNAQGDGIPQGSICDIAIYADDTILYSKCDRHLICGNNLNWLLNLNPFYKTVWTEGRSGFLISMLRKLHWFRLTGLITLFLLM